MLLLDDDADWCDVLRTVLDWHGYDLSVVHRGVDGVREIMASDFDVIICDMLLPAMPGDMFYVAVQQLKPHLCRRFIFVTAHQGGTKFDAFLRIAGGQVLYKPLATDALLSKVKSIVAQTDAMVEKIVAAVESEESTASAKPVAPRREKPAIAARASAEGAPSTDQHDDWVG